MPLWQQPRNGLQPNGETELEGSGDGWVYVIYCDAATAKVVQRHYDAANSPEGKAKTAAAMTVMAAMTVTPY